MNLSWNHENKSREEKVWVEDQLTWNEMEFNYLDKERVKEGDVFAK